MELNPQQSAVMQWAETGSGSLNLIARAGCGKTSTLIELCKRIKGRAFLGAFNKSIATELQERIGNNPNVTAGTMHSLGFSLWRRIKSNSELDSRKIRNLARELYRYDKNAVSVTADAVSYAKQAGFGLKGLDYTLTGNWDKLFDHYDLWDELPATVSPERAVKGCMEIYDKSLEMCVDKKSVIDFDDMLLAPLYYGEERPGMYDWVMVDEAQDTNETRRKLALWVLKPGGRLVAVGDPAQSVYGFAGASNDAMELIKKDLGSSELPLSVTYRCPKSVVALAQTWVPDITAHESAPDGEVSTIDHKRFWLEQLTPNDVILCRNTRPLLGIAKRLRAQGVQCIVEGQSGKALIALATKWGDIEIRELLWRVADYREKEVAKYRAKDPVRDDKIEWVSEKCDMLQDIAGELGEGEPVRKLVARIEFIFGEGENRDNILRLCTIHRSKGREWGRVYLVGRNLYQPSKWAKQEWEIQQEKNLEYVAVTRAKRELVEVVCPANKSADAPDWWELE